MDNPAAKLGASTDRPPYALGADAALAALGSRRDGLDAEQVALRKALHGPNALPAPPPPGWLSIFGRQFLSPLIYVLLAATAVSLFLGAIDDAAFIAIVLLVNAAIGTVQEYHAEHSALALRDTVPNQAMVIRAGESFEIGAADLVPGDIVLLAPGFRVPADLRLTESSALAIDESLLTGESMAVAKMAGDVLPAGTVMADRCNMAFAGTIIEQGRGMGVVTATGLNTEVGKLAGSLAATSGGVPPLLQRMARFTLTLTLVLVGIIVLIGGVELARGTPWQDIFLIAVALAVAAIPEGLPAALTVALAISTRRMARRNVLVRRLVAVEALGSCTMIATDKTGTLTVNQLTVSKLVLPDGSAFEVSGEGIVPQGDFTRDGHTPEPGGQRAIGRAAKIAALCNEAFLGRRDGEWTAHGDSVDIALLVMAHKAGVTRAGALAKQPLSEQIPYEPARGFAATLHECGDGRQIYVKGALERVLPMCAYALHRSGDGRIDAEAIKAQAQTLAQRGFRVLALADGRYRQACPLEPARLQGLTLVGLVAMVDPLRPQAASAMRACRKAGIDVCMITGDHPATALAIARDLGIAGPGSLAITGAQLAAAQAEDEAAVERLVASAHVFARIEPGQKLAIVRALQRLGHFVAVTGDGVNDAPALTAAQVGVAMARSGTDVARESADLLLTDDDFASIVAGVEQGRIAYQNVRKVIFLLISTGAAEIVLFLLTMGAGLPIPLTALQLLWLNLATEGVQDVALAFEPGEGDEMQRNPRLPNEPVFDRIMTTRVIVSACVMGLVAFICYDVLLRLGDSVESARNMVLLLMVMFENVQVFNSRSERRSVAAQSLFTNPFLVIGTIGAQLLHIGAMYTPGLAHILDIAPVTLRQWGVMLLASLTLLGTMEVMKWLARRRSD